MIFNSLKKTVGAALVATLGLGTAALAEYPEKPITLVIPLGAGGSHDLNARVITSIIPTYLNQAMIVRLSPGAGGQKGTQEVSNAAADGYTLLFSHNYIDTTGRTQIIIINVYIVMTGRACFYVKPFLRNSNLIAEDMANTCLPIASHISIFHLCGFYI